MPAITRSQSKNINSINVPQDESKFFNKLKNMLPNAKPNAKPKPINTYDRNKASFVLYFKKMIAYSRFYNHNASKIKHNLNKTKIDENKKPYFIARHKHFYYENVRIVTEILYSILDWLDGFLVVNGVVQNSTTQLLIDTVYSRILEFETQINGAPENPTKEEAHIMNTFVNQLQETKEALNPYISQKQEFARRSNRNIKKVCYMWMDTIEPEDEFDGITNIWEDITIYEDPDYDPSAEEEDEEEEEDVEEDAEEDAEEEAEEEFDDTESDGDEDAYSVYSEEPENNDEADEEDEEYEDFVIERVSSNHIRFLNYIL